MDVKECNAAVFIEPGKPLEMRQFNLPHELEPGAALCKVKMSTICGSDLHTISGRRSEPAPLILGHEIIGEIVALGSGLEYDGFGDKLQIGDIVSWSIMASCGKCFYCKLDLPQKCEKLRKYGHTCCNESPHLTGGYAEYICLFSGTTIYKIPANIPDEIATPANCALSTVINAAETIGLNEGETVLIQGAGLLGLNLVALAVEAGAKKIFITDVLQSRLDLAGRFGADFCINVKDLTCQEIVSQIREQTDGYGVDVAFEICGVKEAVSQAVEALRIGGRYLIAGLVTPGSDLGIDGNQLTRKYITIKGIHNYNPKHLGMALKFLEKYSRKYPYEELVKKVFSLSQINEAVGLASTGKYIRIGIKA
jgi:putative phosphonate catabolism associated alcohol dehydrogenase